MGRITRVFPDKVGVVRTVEVEISVWGGGQISPSRILCSTLGAGLWKKAAIIPHAEELCAPKIYLHTIDHGTYDRNCPAYETEKMRVQNSTDHGY